MVFHTALPLLEYQLNKDYIVKELCENKDIVASCCEGSCYLDKKLKEAQDQEGTTPALRAELQTEYLPKSTDALIQHRAVPTHIVEKHLLPSYRFAVKTCDPKPDLKPPMA